MSKAGYFVVACVVACIAISGYFIMQQSNLFGAETEKIVSRDDRNINKPQEKPLNEHENQDKANNKLNDKSNINIKVDDSQQKSKSKTSTKDLNDDVEKFQGNSEENELQSEGSDFDNKERMENNQEDGETLSSLPTGHLKKLGEHGSPVITDHFEELDYELNGKDFYSHFMKKRTPVVLRGAARKWPAFHSWPNTTYLRDKYGDELFRVEFTKKYENAPPIQKVMSMKEFLGIYDSKEVYLDSPFPQSQMKEDILLPSCLQCRELMSSIRSIHLLFSDGGTSSNFHYDGYENLLSVISGTKEVLLAHYNNSKYFGKNGELFAGVVSPIDPEAVDLIRFPYLSNVTFYKITINAGDILYIPEGWWHHVRSFKSPNIAISLWFGIFKEAANESMELEDSLDSIKRLDAFGEAVKNAPETIECKSQNRPISEVYWPKDNPDIPQAEDPDKWTVTLNTGYKMPMKGFGAAFLKDHKATILTALKAGYRMIDSAQAKMYNEKGVGDALKESNIPREEVFLVSKVSPENLGYEDTLSSVEESLAKFQVSYIDLMLIHSPECDDDPDYLYCKEGMPRGTWRDSWKALELLVESGKVRSIGVSNFDLTLLKELMGLAKIKPAVVQNFFTPFYQDKETRQFCKENDIKYMGYSTLGSQYSHEYGFEENPVLNDEGIKKMARVFEATPSQIVLKWALEKDVIIIPRSNTPHHIETNFNLHHVFLSEKDHAYFDSLDGKFNEEPAETETEQETPKRGKTERTPPVRNKEIIDKLVLEKKVNPDDATIYVSSDDQWIYAIDAKTGNLMWKYGTAEDGGSRCAFSPDETVLYCGTDDKHVRAFNRLDGTLLWKFKPDGAVVSSTRVGADGSLYFGCLDGFMYSVNPDGSLKWKRDLKDQIWASPALKDGGRVVFIGSMVESSSNLFALNGQTGEIIWEYKTGGPVFSSPYLSRDEKVVYECSFDGNCYAFDSESGKVLWTFEGDEAFQSSPIVSEKHKKMYVASTAGTIYAVNTEDGSLAWDYKSSGEYFSSAFPSSNGNVYIGSGEGDVLAFSQDKGELQWKFETATTDALYSSPRMTKDGVLYIGGIDGYLYALNSKNGELVWKFKTYGPLVGTPRIPSAHDMEIE